MLLDVQYLVANSHLLHVGPNDAVESQDQEFEVLDIKVRPTGTVYDILVNAILNSVDLKCFQCLVALPTYLPPFGHTMLRCAYFRQLSYLINH